MRNIDRYIYIYVYIGLEISTYTGFMGLMTYGHLHMVLPMDNPMHFFGK